jgi:peptidase E
MDRELLSLAADSPVVVVPLAGAPGRDYSAAGANGVRHLSALGSREVVVAPDARKDAPGALAAVGDAGLIVLPGGSPRRLLEALQESGLADLLAERVAAGVPMMGSSAGAMVVCEWTVLPQWRGAHRVARGLGLVPGLLAIPHYDGARTAWVKAARAHVPDEIDLLGIPECSGVYVDADALRATGAEPSTLLTCDERLTLAIPGR